MPQITFTWHFIKYTSNNTNKTFTISYIFQGAFYFMLKAFFAFEIFTFFSQYFAYVEKRLDTVGILGPLRQCYTDFAHS